FNLDPALKEIIDSRIAIARATFAKDVDDESAVASCLLYYAGRGLVSLDPDNDGEVCWRATEKLKNSPVPLLDISLLADNAQNNRPEPEVLSSLKLIIEQFIECVRDSNPNLNFNMTLVTWAGVGWVKLMPLPDGCFLWLPKPELYGKNALKA